MIALICSATSVFGHGQHAPKTIDQLTAESKTILHATVESTHSAWNAAADQIYTEVDLKVVESIKGTDQPDSIVTLRLLGGTVGDIRMTIVGQPTFQAGEEVFIYLQANRSNPMPFTAMHEGKLSIANDQFTGQEVVFAEHLEAEPFDAYKANVEVAVFEQEKIILPDGQLLAPVGLPEIADPSINAQEGGEQ